MTSTTHDNPIRVHYANDAPSNCIEIHYNRRGWLISFAVYDEDGFCEISRDKTNRMRQGGADLPELLSIAQERNPDYTIHLV